MISAYELLHDSKIQSLLEKMVLAKSTHLKKLKKWRERFLSSIAYKAELKNFAPEYVETKIFHCFGCEAHGSAIDFVMRFQNSVFKDSRHILSHFNFYL